ncbi:MAG: NAD(P)-dependent oxidoreductase [Xanthobacteraceae bacterium]
MKIAVIGGTGRVGSRIVEELSRRAHDVTVIVRHPENVPARSGVIAVQADVFDVDGLAEAVAGHDVAVSAVHFTASDPARLIAAVKQARIGRYAVVGGAGSLEIAPGVALMSTPEFPAAYKAEAEKGGVFLGLLRRETELDWTFLSPSALFVEGERTGKFRLGGDRLLTDAGGKSWISFEDYAVALADEIERPAHSRQRFTVGY